MSFWYLAFIVIIALVIGPLIRLFSGPCKTWRTIKLGSGIRKPDGFRRALQNAGFQLGAWGNVTLSDPAFTVSEAETEVQLVRVSTAELGFEDGGITKDIYARAKERGLDLCPSEVGPQLRLQYRDQPKGECCVIAMEPIVNSDGFGNIFVVACLEDGTQWLDAEENHPDRPSLKWNPESEWVFQRRN